MKTFRHIIFLLSLVIFSSCGERRAASDSEAKELEAPGVGVAADSADQQLDSTIKAADTTRTNP